MIEFQRTNNDDLVVMIFEAKKVLFHTVAIKTKGYFTDELHGCIYLSTS